MSCLPINATEFGTLQINRKRCTGNEFIFLRYFLFYGLWFCSYFLHRDTGSPLSKKTSSANFLGTWLVGPRIPVVANLPRPSSVLLPLAAALLAGWLASSYSCEEGSCLVLAFITAAASTTGVPRAEHTTDDDGETLFPITRP
jgi:hypothetical protein